MARLLITGEDIANVDRHRNCSNTIRRLLELGGLNAVMGGSGPTVFGLFRLRETAERAAEALRETYMQTYLAKPVGNLDAGV